MSSSSCSTSGSVSERGCGDCEREDHVPLAESWCRILIREKGVAAGGGVVPVRSQGLACGMSSVADSAMMACENGLVGWEAWML